MTTTRRDASDETPFGAWLRAHPELDSHVERLSATDCDMWVHRYSMRDESNRKSSTDIRDAVDSIMLVEVKTHAKDLPFAQRDTLTLVDGLLRKASIRTDGRRQHVEIEDTRLGKRAKRLVRCFGVHLLVLSGSRPDETNCSMRWDNRYFPLEEQLIELLTFRRDPDAPSKMLDTRRHHVLRAKPTLQLFDGDEAA